MNETPANDSPPEAEPSRIPAAGENAASLLAEMNLRLITRHARCILWTAEIEEQDGIPAWRSVSLNVEAAQHVLPLDLPDGVDYSDVWRANCHPEDRQRLDTVAIQAIMAGQPSYQFDYRCRNRHQDERWLSEDVSLLAEGPGRWRAVGVCLDITERKRLEQTLQERNETLADALQRLEQMQNQVIRQERLRALGEMASGIAHDFNNTLVPILGLSELLTDYPDLLNDTSRLLRYLNLIHSSAQDAAKVVSRLREFYRFRSDTDPSEPVDFNALILMAVDLTRPRWKDQALAEGVYITLETDLNATRTVQGAPSALRELISNLILNAVDAMPQGGTLTLSTHEEDDHLVFQVRDTGGGMTPEEAELCFEPFYTAKGKRGSGLGLSVVHGVATRHQGSVAIESVKDAGTTVTIRLPLEAAPTPPPPLPVNRAALPASPTLRILVVEDEEAVREVMVELLSGEGRHIVIAGNGREGLARYEAEPFDLVLTDRAMPEMNGDELAAAIKARNPGQPIILVTGFGEFMSASNEHPAAVDLIVAKPIQPGKLREAIEKLVGAGKV